MNSWFDNNTERLVISFGLIILFSIFKWLLIKIIEKKDKQLRRKYMHRQTATTVINILMIIAVVVVWYEYVSNIITFLGLVTGAFIITSKELILDLISNFVIIWRDLFKVGDRIQIDGYTGDVIQTGPIFVTLAETNKQFEDIYTGNILKIPNSIFITKTLRNYSRGFGLVWNSLEFQIPENDINYFTPFLNDLAEKHNVDKSTLENRDIHNHMDEILFTREKPVLNVTVKDGKALCHIHYISKVNKKTETESQMWQEWIQITEKYKADKKETEKE